jgi:hypothetical protein
MRSPINSREAPSRVQRVISFRMSGMKGHLLGSELSSAPRSCPTVVPDYGELPTVAVSSARKRPFIGEQPRL